MADDPLNMIASLRAEHARRTSKPAPGVLDPPRSTAKAFDFSTLKGYSDMRFKKAASETIGLESPFFRVGEAVDGPRIKIDGRWRTNFASYDYLGLNQSQAVIEAAQSGVATWGFSASASRLVGGEKTFHGALERDLAAHYGTEAALVMVSGHATNVGLIRTLLGKGDLVMVDQLAHNSIYEGITASGAAHLSFPHNDPAWLDAKLDEVRDQYRHVLIAIEGLYSMDGDVPDLAAFVDIKSRHDAWLLVDEAHSMGVLGATGRGIAEHCGVDPGRIEMFMGTLSKTLCSCGGYVCGSHALMDYLRFKAPGFVFSVGLPGPAALASQAALRQVTDSPERTDRLRSLGQRFHARARAAGLDTGLSIGSAVAPIIIGDSLKSVIVSDRLFKRDINALPIIFPAVQEKAARLRFFLTAMHSDDDVDRAVDIVAEEVARVRDTDLRTLLESAGA